MHKRNLSQDPRLTRDSELRIHEHTERGDNDSVKKPKNNSKTDPNFKCCSER
jgi:hypothetical protein